MQTIEKSNSNKIEAMHLAITRTAMSKQILYT